MKDVKETKLVLWAVDLAGFARATGSLEALAVAALADDWYHRCGGAVRGAGGRVVKFMGDGCLAVFSESQVVAAVEGAVALRREVPSLCAKHHVALDVGANVHIGVVAEGEFGDADSARYDILGNAVVHLFRMGGGSGIRISEPVYRSLPNELRSAWDKNRPPATYSLAR
jgi:adenylate cyclase